MESSAGGGKAETGAGGTAQSQETTRRACPPQAMLGSGPPPSAVTRPRAPAGGVPPCRGNVMTPAPQRGMPPHQQRSPAVAGGAHTWALCHGNAPGGPGLSCDTPKCREQKLAVNQEPGKRSAVPHGDMASGFIGEASRQLHNRPRGIAQRLKEVGTKNLSKETGCLGSPAGHASSPLPKSMLSPLGGSWVSARQRMLSRAGPEGIGPELLVTIFS